MTDLLTLREQYEDISKEQFAQIGRVDFDAMARVANRIRHSWMNFYALLSQCDEELSVVKSEFARDWILTVAKIARYKMTAEWAESSAQNQHLARAVELAEKYQ